MASDRSSFSDVARELRGLLAFQGELGLRGLDVASDVLAPKVGAAAAVAAAETAAADRGGRQAPAAPTPGRSERSAPIPPALLPGSAGQSGDGASRPAAATDPAQRLRLIREQIGDCTRCKLHKGRTTIVFGNGDPRARLMFVGEGPGRDEDLQGEPFVGAAGQLLDKMIAAMGLRRSQVYIGNCVKCRPPNNRDPEPDEIAACAGFLDQQIDVVQPEVLVALGRYACQTLLRDTTPISRLRGKWREYLGIPLMPTFHPAYLLRTPSDKRLVWEDLQQVMHRLGLTPPAKRA